MPSELRQLRFDIEMERRLLRKQMSRDALHPRVEPVSGQRQLPMAGFRVNAAVPVRDESGETDDVKVLQNELERLRGLASKQIARMALYPIGPVPSLVDEDTPWCGIENDKLYLQSGQFTSTLKTSEDLSGTTDGMDGISWDGTNTPWSGRANDTNDKLYLQSGQFSSTIKTSETVNSIDIEPHGISWDGTNTPWIGQSANKLYLQSGQFTSTLKTSEDVSGIDTGVTGISWDGTNTPWSGTQSVIDKLYLQSGQFTSTLKTSEDVSALTRDIQDIGWDGTDTLWCGGEFAADPSKLYLQSGQFTSTLKTSVGVRLIDNIASGINTNKRTTG